jgi:Flp pilus assembly protein TadD
MSIATLLPTSSAVLGAIVQDLQLHLQPGDIARSSREFLAGRRNVKDETREAIMNAIAVALVDQRYIPAVEPLPPPFTAGSLADIVATAIDVWAHQWDGVVGGIEGEALGTVQSEFVALACLRLVVVELAIRVAAFVRLASGRPLICQCGYCTGAGIARPRWAEADGRRTLLADLRSQCGARTLDEFAALIDFAPSAVDTWVREKDSIPPPREALETIATAMVRNSPGKTIDRAECIVWLRWQFALATVADRIAGHLGRERVRDLGSAFARLFASALEFLRRSGMTEEVFRARMVETIMAGSRASGIEFLLNTLASNEHDPAWADAVRATGNGWGPAIQTTIKTEQSKARVAEVLVEKDDLPLAEAKMLTEIVTRDVPYAATHSNASATSKADALVRLSAEAQQRGDLASSAMYLRGAVDLDPDRPELRQDLGGTLGKIGRFDDALMECRRALELRPGWSIPLVQIGIILLDAHRNDDALAHLEDIVARVPWSVTLGHSLGIAQMRAHQFREAITSFERILAEVPKHASALDLAAHCYLMIQNWSRGRELAKLAHGVGAHETWTALEAGQYRRYANELKRTKRDDD